MWFAGFLRSSLWWLLGIRVLPLSLRFSLLLSHSLLLLSLSLSPGATGSYLRDYSLAFLIGSSGGRCVSWKRLFITCVPAPPSWGSSSPGKVRARALTPIRREYCWGPLTPGPLGPVSQCWPCSPLVPLASSRSRSLSSSLTVGTRA